MMKTNPLLKLNEMGGDFFHDDNIPNVSEHSEDNMDSPCHIQPHKVRNCSYYGD